MNQEHEKTEDPAKTKSVIESLLFVSGDPVKFSKIAQVAGISSEEAERFCDEIAGDYSDRESGKALLKKDGEVQMVTSSENSEAVTKFLKSEMQESLSRAAIETLAIAAYRGPVSRAEIEMIRGVNSSFTLRALLMRGLLEKIDNSKDSRSYLYRVSFDFLRFLGVDSPEKLPDWEKLSRDERVDSIIGEKNDK